MPRTSRASAGNECYHVLNRGAARGEVFHEDDDYAAFLILLMQWLPTSHVRRYHRHYDSGGHVWQRRFKAVPIQQDEQLLGVSPWQKQTARRLGLESSLRPRGPLRKKPIK